MKRITLCNGCGYKEEMSAYAVAQLTMGHEITFTCTKCKEETELTL